MSSELTAVDQGSGLALHDGSVRRGSFVLGPLSLTLRPGEVTALVGANGAGKTTLLSLITGQLQLATGTICYAGQQQTPTGAAWHRLLGYVPDDPAELLEELTADEFWRFTARVHLRGLRGHVADATWTATMQRCRALAEYLHFAAPERVLIGAFSLGMRRKTQLINALMTDPAIVVMDEPRNGLDPLGIARLHELIDVLRGQGKIVLASSHDVEWALGHADRVVGLRAGSLAFDHRLAEPSTPLTSASLLEMLS
ncbi:MAG: ATP-binding cassette domain-containing protein [Candidatus Nanopelagicales bacterium]